MAKERPSGVSVAVAFVLDAALLLGFVLIGRANHGEGLPGALQTWWPFLVGLAVGWLVTRAWRNPFRVFATGIGVWLITVAVAMILRALTDQGVQSSFVFVTLVVVGGFLLGWRAIAWMGTALFGKVPDATSDVSSRQ